MSDPLGPVVITAREVYDAVVRLTAAVERLVDQHSDTERELKDHESRLRALESSRWPLPAAGILIALAALAAALVPLVTR